MHKGETPKATKTPEATRTDEDAGRGEHQIKQYGKHAYQATIDEANHGEKPPKKSLSNLSTAELMALDYSELEKHDLREILEAKARLELEYKERFKLEYNEQAANESTTTEADELVATETAELPAKDTSGIDTIVADNPDAESGPIDIEPTDDSFSTAETKPMDTIPPGSMPNLEPITPEEIRAVHFREETKQALKEKPGIREFFKQHGKKALAIVAPTILAIVAAVGIAVGAATQAHEQAPDLEQQPAIERVADQDQGQDQDKSQDQGQNRTDKTDSASSQTADEKDQAKKSDQGKNTEQSSQAYQTSPSEAYESSAVSGRLSNGTHYDYSEYADRDHKESYNAFGYDASDCYGDIEKSKAGIMKKASDMEGALGAYAYGFFNDAEKAELGISGMTAVEIDDYISNNPDGGAMQQRLLAALEQGLNNKDTTYEFYYENDTEQTDYIYFIDDNQDGRMDPTEMHLAYDTKVRENAPQLNIYRNGVKVLDLNLQCGWQTNYEPGHAPDGVPYVPADTVTDQGNPDTGSEGTGSEGTGSEDTGSEGTGSEDTGSEGTGSEDTGSEGTGSEGTGEEGTGSEGTGEEDTGIKPKDAENLERIDQNILDDIADDVGTDEVKVTPNPGVSNDDLTEKPSSEDYQGTEADIVQNQPSQDAEPVQDSFSDANDDYDQNRGGANAGEYAPVQENDQAQQAADAAEIPQDQAPTSGQDLDDALKDLGIN